jgi:hypothetical protein
VGGLVAANVTALGLTSTVLGGLRAGTLGQCASTNLAEVVLDQGPALTLAQFPNINATTGLPAWANIVSVQNDQTEFRYGSDVAAHVANWSRELDPWLHGFWAYDWADSFVSLASVNQSTSEFLIDPSTPPTYEFNARARYRGVNLLSELDTVEEFYIDRTHGVAYLLSQGYYPNAWISVPVPVIQQVGSGADLSRRLMVEDANDLAHRIEYEGRSRAERRGDWRWTTPVTLFSNASRPLPLRDTTTLSYVTFANLTLRFGASGMQLPSVSNIVVDSVDASYATAQGIYVAGTNISLSNVVANYTGCTAIGLYAGDVPSLTPGYSSLTDSVAVGYARYTRTYNPGVSWGGVGNAFSNIYVADAPHQGFLGGGTLNTFTNITFTDLCWEVDDSGAWYSGHSWIERNNSILQSSFSNIRTLEPVFLGYPSVQSIYNDDQLSFNTFLDNYFYNAQCGLFVGGGRAHVAHGNTFDSCENATLLDDRGLNWQNSSCVPPNGILWVQLQQVLTGPYNATWYSTFPDLYNFVDPCTPVFNVITDNFWCGGDAFIDDTAEQLAQWQCTVENNTQTC